MHELQAIINAFETSQQQGETTFLATIVNTLGSTYRQKGAKMLITETGEMVGTLSGGCVENDIWQYTKQIKNKPLLISYDATSEEDLIWGFGLGCNGAVQILLEKLDCLNHLSPLNLIIQCLKHKKYGAIATIFAVEGEIDVKIGSRFILYPDDSTYTDIHAQELKKAIARDTTAAKNRPQSTVNRYLLSSGRVEVFIEVIKPPPALIIFGAGRDALPVVELAKTIGWEVTVVDCRAQAKTYQRFALADQVILTRRDIISQQISVDENTVAIVMTHNYFDDREIIKFLLPTKIPYLGVMGSKNRIAKIIKELNPTQIQLAKLYSPIGLDIGADTSIEIASAIVTEIQAILAKRKGGFLKHRSQPLHPRSNLQLKQVEPIEKVLKIEPK
jgi:xanthine/CO dehydrogenase XdhC/CoxF family maturation factor